MRLPGDMVDRQRYAGGPSSGEPGEPRSRGEPQFAMGLMSTPCRLCLHPGPGVGLSVIRRDNGSPSATDPTLGVLDPSGSASRPAGNPERRKPPAVAAVRCPSTFPSPRLSGCFPSILLSCSSLLPSPSALSLTFFGAFIEPIVPSQLVQASSRCVALTSELAQPVPTQQPTQRILSRTSRNVITSVRTALVLLHHHRRRTPPRRFLLIPSPSPPRNSLQAARYTPYSRTGWINQHVEVFDPPHHGHGECQRHTKYDRTLNTEETVGLGARFKTRICPVVRTQEGCGEFPYLGVCRCEKVFGSVGRADELEVGDSSGK